MWNVLNTHKLTKGVAGDLGDGYVCGLDDGDGFVDVYLPPNLSRCTR